MGNNKKLPVSFRFMVTEPFMKKFQNCAFFVHKKVKVKNTYSKNGKKSLSENTLPLPTSLVLLL